MIINKNFQTKLSVINKKEIKHTEDEKKIDKPLEMFTPSDNAMATLKEDHSTEKNSLNADHSPEETLAGHGDHHKGKTFAEVSEISHFAGIALNNAAHGSRHASEAGHHVAETGHHVAEAGGHNSVSVLGIAGTLAAGIGAVGLTMEGIKELKEGHKTQGTSTLTAGAACAGETVAGLIHATGILGATGTVIAQAATTGASFLGGGHGALEIGIGAKKVYDGYKAGDKEKITDGTLQALTGGAIIAAVATGGVGFALGALVLGGTRIALHHREDLKKLGNKIGNTVSHTWDKVFHRDKKIEATPQEEIKNQSSNPGM